MSDQPETLGLKLILRNTEHASRDAQAAMEVTERLVVSIGARFDALESRVTSLEIRMTAVEKGLDAIARSNHRMEQMLGDILARLG